MSAQAACHPARTRSATSRRNLLAFFRAAARRAPRLDPDALPDYLRRDLGFASGRISPPRDLLRD
jgi:hypothetical protein